MIGFTFDPDANAAYVKVSEGDVNESIEIETEANAMIMIDLDADGELVGVEIVLLGGDDEEV